MSVCRIRKPDLLVSAFQSFNLFKPLNSFNFLITPYFYGRTAVVPPPLYACSKKLITMHSTETINQFLNLRVQGWSFARIAEQLQVSKPTLLAWNRKYHSRIDSMK